MRWYSYLNSAARILKAYNGKIPFHHFIRNDFRENKKYGSKDRRFISQFCFSYFRTGKSLETRPIEECIMAGYFLTSEEPSDALSVLRPEWNEFLKGAPTLSERINFLKTQIPDFHPEKLFPFTHRLGAVSDVNGFSNAHLRQPDVFLRLRPGSASTVSAQLKQAGIPFAVYGNTVTVPSGTPVDQALELNRHVVVQDASSQRVGEFIEKAAGLLPPKPKVWDCCAASGGKSILATDILGNLQLTVSDIRESILHNLRQRLQEANIRNYHSFSADLSSENSFLPLEVNTFDLVMADVPCTGSGTWSRTPEQLMYFREDEINGFAELQYKILQRVLPFVKKNGLLLYITCSVFRSENEDMVMKLEEEQGLTALEFRYLEGYARKADTLFACLLKKP